MKKIVCGTENVKKFNQQMRELVPEFHALAKQLHAAGLINGLRGATLELPPFTEQQTTEQPIAARYCKTCGHWHKPLECAKQGAKA